jgi:hypothetical protein
LFLIPRAKGHGPHDVKLAAGCAKHPTRHDEAPTCSGLETASG